MELCSCTVTILVSAQPALTEGALCFYRETSRYLISLSLILVRRNLKSCRGSSIRRWTSWRKNAIRLRKISPWKSHRYTIVTCSPDKHFLLSVEINPHFHNNYLLTIIFFQEFEQKIDPSWEDMALHNKTMQKVDGLWLKLKFFRLKYLYCPPCFVLSSFSIVLRCSAFCIHSRVYTAPCFIRAMCFAFTDFPIPMRMYLLGGSYRKVICSTSNDIDQYFFIRISGNVLRWIRNFGVLIKFWNMGFVFPLLWFTYFEIFSILFLGDWVSQEREGRAGGDRPRFGATS